MAKAQLDFSGAGNIINPLKDINTSLASTSATMGDLLAQSRKDAILKQQQEQQAIQNRRADAQLAIQQANADRLQEAYDKKLNDQGIINSVMSAKNVGKSSIDTSYLNQQYVDLADKYNGVNVEQPSSNRYVLDNNGNKVLNDDGTFKTEVIPNKETAQALDASLAYQKDLDALNNSVFKNVEAGTDQYYGSHAQIADNIQQDLIAKDIDYQTAKTLAESKAQDIKPIVDAKTIADQKKYNLDLMKAMYPTKSGSNNVYINGGSDSIGGPDKEVVTRGQAINDIANIIKENDDGQGLKSWFEDKFGKDPATAKNMWKLVEGARKNHLSDYQIAAELQGSIEHNFIAKDTIPSLNDFVARAKLNNTKSSRTTYKGGGNSADSLLMEADKKRAFDSLVQQNAALDRQNSPTFDRYQYALDNAFDKTPYKAKENKAKGGKSTSLFTGNDVLSNAMRSKTAGETAKLSVEHPDQFSKLYNAMSNAQKRRVDKVLRNEGSLNYFNSIKETATSVEPKESEVVKAEKTINNINSSEDEVNKAQKVLDRSALNSRLNYIVNSGNTEKPVEDSPWYSKNYNLGELIGKGGNAVAKGLVDAVRSTKVKNLYDAYNYVDKKQGQLSKFGEKTLRDLFTSKSTKINERNSNALLIIKSDIDSATKKQELKSLGLTQAQIDSLKL